ncbi:MAG: hypothetical protein J3R72DRAFT_465036 [Linnemannia gamsii]|nr:MAG: hypothetical protein J3R72DRAFT_465036 [Linnemannia gamsii]
MPKHPNLVIVIRGNMQVTFNEAISLRLDVIISNTFGGELRTIKDTVYTCSWYTAIQLDEPAMSSHIVAPPQSPTSHYSGSSSPSHYSNHGDSSPSPPAYHHIEPSPPSPAPPPPTTSSGPDTIASPASSTPPSPSTCAPEVEPTTTPDSSPPPSTCTPEVEPTTTPVSSPRSSTCSPPNVNLARPVLLLLQQQPVRPTPLSSRMINVQQIINIRYGDIDNMSFSGIEHSTPRSAKREYTESPTNDNDPI